MRVIVLAGNYAQFRNWCDETGFFQAPFLYVDKHGRKWQAVFCDSEGYNLQGMRYDAYIKTGTWQDCSDRLKSEFEIRKRIARYDAISAS